MAHFMGFDITSGEERTGGVSKFVCGECRGTRKSLDGKECCKACEGTGIKKRRGQEVVKKDNDSKAT